MNLSNQSTVKTTVATVPIRNIWLLLLYASDLYQTLGEQQRVQLENNPEDLIKLVAKLYCQAVGKRLMRSLSCGYQQHTQVLNRVRGKIDMLVTARQQLLEKGRIQCHFDNLTIDTPKNRYIHAAAHALLLQLQDKMLIRQCQKIITRFTALKIGQSTHYDYLTDYFDQSGKQDKTLLTLCRLIFNLAIPTELAGIHQVEQVEKNDHWLRHLFEKAVAGFCRANLNSNDWKISTGKRLYWQQQQASSGIKNFLPNMQTDLIIEHRSCNYRLIIDTKCTNILKPSRFSEKTFSSNHIYQLYAYLKSQENTTDSASLNASGMLLYPTIDSEVREQVFIQGHHLSFNTIDLSLDTALIRNNLLTLLSKCAC
jgi:5-methylcytosine-specific restriction enzyme subunit McrC